MRITVRGALHGDRAEATFENGHFGGDPLLVTTILGFRAIKAPVQLPGVIEGAAGPEPGQLDQLVAATMWSVVDDGTAELTVEPRQSWLPSGRVAAKRRVPTAGP